MADWSELKRLAEAAAEIESWYEERDFYAGGISEMELDIVRSSDRDFIIATSPAAILALIAESERLQAERDKFSDEAQKLDDFSETLGLEIAEAGKREIAHRAEVEVLRDVIKDMVFAMQVNPSCQMGVVERCRCWFCAIGRAKAAMGKGGRADG